jgi:Spy/CpxP family protein refolding chaperone
MKRYVTLIVIIALFGFSVGLSAQEQRAGEKKDYPKNEKIEQIGANYGDQMLELRSKITVKQIELKSLLRDPNASEEKILSIADDIQTLMVEVQKMMINYQLDIRKVLTPEQIKTWYTLENPSAKRGRRQ